MNLYNICQIQSEDEAEKYLQNLGVLKIFSQCIYCQSPSLGRIRRRKIKCYRCKKEWDAKKGSILERFRVTLQQFVLAAKCFELNLDVSQCARECMIDFSTASKIYQVFYTRIKTIFLENISISADLHIKLGYSPKRNLILLIYPEVVNTSDIVFAADISLKRIRYAHKKFGYKIADTNLNISLNRKIHAKVIVFLRELSKHFAVYSHTNIKTIEAFLYKLLFSFHYRNECKTEKLLILCGSEVGG